ncbi:MAG: hypothetical protein Q7O12_05655 [Deltaproteobacteria bacterium]|nr:hypothetical protein [Deltaproteobacteria bacterium]
MGLLQELTAVKRGANKEITRPHILKHWFAERGIPNVRIAEKLGVKPMSISKWLNGQVRVPKERNEQLYALAQEIKALI